MLQQQGRLPRPGEGPSAAQRRANWFRIVLVAEAEGGEPSQRLYGRVSGGDAGCAQRATMANPQP